MRNRDDWVLFIEYLNIHCFSEVELREILNIHFLSQVELREILNIHFLSQVGLRKILNIHCLSEVGQSKILIFYLWVNQSDFYFKCCEQPVLYCEGCQKSFFYLETVRVGYRNYIRVDLGSISKVTHMVFCTEMKTLCLYCIRPWTVNM